PRAGAATSQPSRPPYAKYSTRGGPVRGTAARHRAALGSRVVHVARPFRAARVPRPARRHRAPFLGERALAGEQRLGEFVRPGHGPRRPRQPVRERHVRHRQLRRDGLHGLDARLDGTDDGLLSGPDPRKHAVLHIESGHLPYLISLSFLPLTISSAQTMSSTVLCISSAWRPHAPRPTPRRAPPHPAPPHRVNCAIAPARACHFAGRRSAVAADAPRSRRPSR